MAGTLPRGADAAAKADWSKGQGGDILRTRRMAFVYVLTPLSLEEATDRLDSFYEALLDHEDEVVEGDLEVDIEILGQADLPKRFSGRKGSAPKAKDALDQVRLC